MPRRSALNPALRAAALAALVTALVVVTVVVAALDASGLRLGGRRVWVTTPGRGRVPCTSLRFLPFTLFLFAAGVDDLAVGFNKVNSAAIAPFNQCFADKDLA